MDPEELEELSRENPATQKDWVKDAQEALRDAAREIRELRAQISTPWAV